MKATFSAVVILQAPTASVSAVAVSVGIRHLENGQAPPATTSTGDGAFSANFINFLDKRQAPTPTTTAAESTSTDGGVDANFINFLD
ncbi:hypothetical protein QBC35DRAFT_456260 [Podospora australis]|uniref:Secreted protein n=1 Tax=Podospora australis TaxID=1536484 RepID=A0AAN6WK02_9PEZI|nr:hypothetical protein QBC35DRAFT_456260 [Podospora australis]